MSKHLWAPSASAACWGGGGPHAAYVTSRRVQAVRSRSRGCEGPAAQYRPSRDAAVTCAPAGASRFRLPCRARRRYLQSRGPPPPPPRWRAFWRGAGPSAVCTLFGLCSGGPKRSAYDTILRRSSVNNQQSPTSIGPRSFNPDERLFYFRRNGGLFPRLTLPEEERDSPAPEGSPLERALGRGTG